MLTDTQVSKICKAFVNGSSANIKFSKTQLSKMIQSGGILGELLVALPYGVLEAVTQELKKRAPVVTRGATRYFVHKGINRLKKDFIVKEGWWITLTNNEIKDFTKVFKSLENRGILLKGTTTNITSQKEEF